MLLWLLLLPPMERLSGGVSPGEEGASFSESTADPCAFSGETAAEAYAWATWTAPECTGGAVTAQAVALAHALDTIGFAEAPLVERALLQPGATRWLFEELPAWERAPYRGTAWVLATGLAAGDRGNPTGAAMGFLAALESAISIHHAGVPAPPVLSPSRSSAKTIDAAFWQRTINDLRAERAYLETL